MYASTAILENSISERGLKLLFWLKTDRNRFRVSLNALGIVLSSKIGVIPLTGAIIVQPPIVPVPDN